MQHTKSSIVKERKIPESEAEMSDAKLLEHYHKNVRGNTGKADFALGIKAQQTSEVSMSFALTSLEMQNSVSNTK